MMKIASLLIVFNAILIFAEQTYTEVHLNYYMTPYNNYGGTVCNLNYYAHRKERYLTFDDIKKLDPELHCLKSLLFLENVAEDIVQVGIQLRSNV